MKFAEIIEKNINKTIDSIATKNKKLTFLNNISVSLKNEYDSLNDAYTKLGKYYYENMRDNENAENQEICSQIDKCIANIDKLKNEYYGTMSTEYNDPVDGEIDIEIFEVPTDSDEKTLVEEIEKVNSSNSVKTISGEAEDIEENTSDEAAEEVAKETAEETADISDNEKADADKSQDHNDTDNDNKKDDEDDSYTNEIVSGINDLYDSDEFVINKSFENLGDNVSVLDIKKDDENRNINIDSESPEDLIALAYSQISRKRVADLNNDSLEDVISNIFGNDIVADEIVDNEVSNETNVSENHTKADSYAEDSYKTSRSVYEEIFSDSRKAYGSNAAEPQIEDPYSDVLEIVNDNVIDDLVNNEYIEDSVPNNIDSIDSANYSQESLQRAFANYFSENDSFNIDENAQSLRPFDNWNRVSQDLTDDINYICNNDSTE